VLPEIDSISLQHQYIWQQKPSLRIVYEEMYARIGKECRSGRTLEIGGGIGNFKDYWPGTINLDIQSLPWTDTVADAHLLPFVDGSFDNIVVIDTLHHLVRPIRFFREAKRVLKSTGRLVIVEPMISPLSHFFYNRFHPEPVDMLDAPLEDGPLDPNRQPFDSNQAIPTILFLRQRKKFEKYFPEFTILLCKGFGLFAYPLSGGFRPWTGLPVFLAPLLLCFERRVEGLLAPTMGFRMIVTLEKI
jgi:SAM-dependent methyltransferase